MSNYHVKPIILPSSAAKEAKAARQKQLEEVRKRRARIAKAQQEKAQTAYHTNEDYQDHLREEALL